MQGSPAKINPNHKLRPHHSSDPITNGVKLSLIAKFDLVSSRGFASADIKTRSNGPRACKAENSSRGKQKVSSQRSEHCDEVKLRKTSAVSLNNGREGKQASVSRKSTLAQLTINHMAGVRHRTMADEETMLRNPFYKIMKPRPRRHPNGQNRMKLITNIAGSETKKINTEYLQTECGGEQTLKSQYIGPNTEGQLRSNRVSCKLPSTRKKSDTKIYEEIKKYFEQKYVHHSNSSKQTPKY